MVTATLIERYGSIHLRESSKTWNDQPSWDSKGGKGKGKTQGNNFRRVGYVGVEEENVSWNDEEWNDYADDRVLG